MGNETGISKSSVSRICGDIDEVVDTFMTRSLDHTWFPYLYRDATYLDVRLQGHVVSQAVEVAVGVSALGRREILGMAVGDSESTDFWTEFLRSLRQRGLNPTSPTRPEGVALVISDAHTGLKAAVKAVLPGAGWQRCRVHFARNITQHLGSATSSTPQQCRSRPAPPDGGVAPTNSTNPWWALLVTRSVNGSGRGERARRDRSGARLRTRPRGPSSRQRARGRIRRG